MVKDILIANQKNIEPKHKNKKEPYDYYIYQVTNRADFNQCYVAFYDILPKKYNYPYHYHFENTEVFYIIKGNGILETPKGNIEIKTGDVIVCPPGKEGAHRILNTSDSETLNYIDIDTTNSPDIIKYPNSNKTGIIVHNQSSTFYQDGTEVDYYDGE